MSTKLSLQGQGRIQVGTGSITTTALAAGAEEALTISDTEAAVGDLVIAHLDATAAGTAGTPIIARAWVSAAGTITCTVSNLHASAALDAGAKGVIYALIRTT